MNKLLAMALAGSLLVHFSLFAILCTHGSVAPANAFPQYISVSVVRKEAPQTVPAPAETRQSASVPEKKASLEPSHQVIKQDTLQNTMMAPVEKPVESTALSGETVIETSPEIASLGEAVENTVTSGFETMESIPAASEIILPQELHFPKPPYPVLAKKRRLEGTVQVAIYINTDGHVDKMEVIASSGYRLLDEAALSIKEQLFYSPALEDGQAVAYTLTKTVIFRLES